MKMKVFKKLSTSYAPSLAGLYANTVNCLPMCHALGARGVAGKVRLITTDLFAEMSPYFQKGTITAYGGQTHQQNSFPAAVHLSPGLVTSSNLHLFREMRPADSKRDEPGPKNRLAL